MEKNIFGTPEPSLSVELRKVLNEENILTKKTKKRVLEALDEHIVNDEDRKLALNRQKIIQEIYSSEESYINRLEILIKFFKKPIEENHLIPVSVLNALFGNIETICDVNKEFLTRLKGSKENIVSAFLSTAPFFKVYSIYAYGYKNVINILESMPRSNPSLHEFISRQETRPEVSNKLSSLLISPVQRIPRYLLLLKELKASTPKSSYAYTELEEAVKEMNNIVEHIETLMKEQENIGRMIKIQRCLQNGKPKIITPGRKLLKEGKLDKVLKDEISPRYIVLLNDMILYCKDWTGSSLKCLRVLPVDKCVINAIGFKRGVFSLQCQSFSVILSSKDNQELTHDWVEAIQNAIDQCKKNKQSLRRMSSQRRPLQRKDFNKLEDDNVLARKRPNVNQEQSNDVCISSPWKRMKSSCTTVENHDPKKAIIETENISQTPSEESASYVKLAKQFIHSVKQTTQKFIRDADPVNCHSVTDKIAAITE